MLLAALGFWLGIHDYFKSRPLTIVVRVTLAQAFPIIIGSTDGPESSVLVRT